jgi:hypothetical protein
MSQACFPCGSNYLAVVAKMGKIAVSRGRKISVAFGTKKASAKDRYEGSGEETAAPDCRRTVLSDLLRHHVVG